MKNFFTGFEKRAYNYDWEAKREEQRMSRRQHEEPVHLGKAMGVGAGLAGLAGAGMGAAAAARGSRIGGAGIGALLGAGMGALGGAGVHLGQKSDIKDSKRVMAMDPDSRGMLLRHRAREEEEGRRNAAMQQAAMNAALYNSMLQQGMNR